MGRQLDGLVAPFGGAVLAGDQPRAVHAPQVAVDEGVSGLGPVLGAIGQAEVPFRIGVPVVGLKEAKLNECVRAAQKDRVVITRNGKPVALIVGVDGMDLEQLELGDSQRFWNLIRRTRRQKSMSRAELEDRLARS